MYFYLFRGPCPEDHMFVAIRKKLRGKCVETICKVKNKTNIYFATMPLRFVYRTADISLGA